MEKKQTTKKTKQSKHVLLKEPRTGIIVDGEVFPFSMTCKEFDGYQEFLKTRQLSEK